MRQKNFSIESSRFKLKIKKRGISDGFGKQNKRPQTFPHAKGMLNTQSKALVGREIPKDICYFSAWNNANLP